MEAFKKGILAWAVVPLITGAIAILVGPPFWRLVGMELSAPGFSDPILDSQVRFLGTVWFGYGVLMCVCARDLKKYAGLLRTALLLVFLGGIARLASIVVVGMPGSIPGVLIISTVLIAELLLMPALLWWQRRVMQRRFQ
jgi:hypothetical protein